MRYHQLRRYKNEGRRAEKRFGKVKVSEKTRYDPAMYPEELPKRCIKMLSYVGATVLDPFMGAGTTGVVCKKYNRRFIGFEMDEKYFNTAKERIDTIEVDMFAS